MCIGTQTVYIYIYIYVFVGATTGHNHFWWISTLALGSSKFSSGWLMGLLTDVCTNLLLLPPLPAFVPLPQVCVSERVSCCALAGCGCSFQILLMDFPLFSWTKEAEREGWVGQCCFVRAQTISIKNVFIYSCTEVHLVLLQQHPDPKSTPNSNYA